MFRGRIPFTQMAFATLLGFGGGIYIYRPLFGPVQKLVGQHDQDEPNTEEQTDTNNSALPKNI
ncbi:protein PIGBOS1 [Genypterus blacodes]|uniref:protein PIGBOS1 n=1 Tax=Genypterus blacodes TaxID=154954 RepID=UPI003F75DF98